MGKLSGKKEIQKYLDMSWPSIMRLKDLGLPLKKICGRWFSHTESIDQFIKTEVETDEKKRACQVN